MSNGNPAMRKPPARESAKTAMTHARAKCGVKTRSGKSCQAKAVAGGSRCRVHSVCEPGNTNAATPGSLYSQFLTPEERELWHCGALDTTALEAELALTKIRLRRALAAEEAARGGAELDSRTTRMGGGEGGDYVDVVERVRDYPAIIDRLTARIATLEMQQRDLAAKDRDILLKDQALEIGALDKTIKGAQARDADKGDGVTGFTFTVKRLTAEVQPE